ncbi:CRISPR-associated endonuclease Cas3'' [Tepidiforma thermophila]|uniref:CRISPR-associated endonuclease Cas3-HD n=1 Tax=Tepidiforma thermophila (strain KCTC 52669 / CGMCC 1.13589 / G233) TaxID=2761530 RepID=A0A2A9HD68_TEPT2|nr:CRISPR-associated endonuclease Cas3'' [Tepidiforma thermophila]PFG73092.1 CRISPR-associated endonuclease Cas3-HD [Tepidiforma thermophila]
MPFYARSTGPNGQWQPLRDHLLAVGELAARFAAEAGLDPEPARWAGLLHDLGKYSEEFQEHRLRRRDWVVEHAAHGAAWAVEHNSVEAAFAVAGHHSGLPNKATLVELRHRPERCPVDVGTVMERARRFAALAESEGVFTGAPPATPVPLSYSTGLVKGSCHGRVRHLTVPFAAGTARLWRQLSNV